MRTAGTTLGSGSRWREVSRNSKENMHELDGRRGRMLLFRYLVETCVINSQLEYGNDDRLLCFVSLASA